jgi:hypothetical protein
MYAAQDEMLTRRYQNAYIVIAPILPTTFKRYAGKVQKDESD